MIAKTTIARASMSAAILLRMVFFVIVLIGPIGAFAALHANSDPDNHRAGLVLFVSLERAG
ncbi:hypothetical protein [Phyllobacterium leguminum]|uniref:Uncharacterized protein n=1 Tax=Phyllobacterium leguminum TaxID=314237 RepID=A0A318THQ2_9HYPH|nr:hypothetical protein [Phyllobacterium leguminum]PYE88428.1 hypothetical protein C7477_10770 [Phyllobacterium leguminum]